MRKISLKTLPEIFVSDKQLTNLVYQELKKGKIRKVASRLYTRNLEDNPETIIKRNIWSIVAAYYPGALISDRTALEHSPAKDGSIYIISNKKRSTKIPGITIYPRKGIPPLESDKSFISGLFLSSNVRAFLENMKFSRSRKANISRTLSRKEIEVKLESMLQLSGNKALLGLRDEARILSKKLNLQNESKILDELIGTLLGTRDSLLSSDPAIMRKAGTPYDSKRLELFQLLFEKLSATQPIIRFSQKLTEEGIINLAFFEAYFSNFIEGTEFAVNEAEDIIFNGKIPIGRPDDAHDIIGTYKVVSE